MGVETPRNYLQFFKVSQFCLFVQQNIFRLRLLNIGVYVYQTEIHAGMHKTHHFEIKKNAAPCILLLRSYLCLYRCILSCLAVGLTAISAFTVTAF